MYKLSVAAHLQSHSSGGRDQHRERAHWLASLPLLARERFVSRNTVDSSLARTMNAEPTPAHVLFTHPFVQKTEASELCVLPSLWPCSSSTTSAMVITLSIVLFLHFTSEETLNILLSSSVSTGMASLSMVLGWFLGELHMNRQIWEVSWDFMAYLDTSHLFYILPFPQTCLQSHDCL